MKVYVHSGLAIVCHGVSEAELRTATLSILQVVHLTRPIERQQDDVDGTWIGVRNLEVAH